MGLGLFVINLVTGEHLTGDEIYGAEVVGCIDETGKDCFAKLTGNLNQTQQGFMDFSKILSFVTLTSEITVLTILFISRILFLIAFPTLSDVAVEVDFRFIVTIDEEEAGA